MRRTWLSLAVIFAVAGATFAVSFEDAKYTVKEVMKKANNGRDSLLNKVKSGNATDAEKAKLLEYYESMPAGKVKKGDADDFKKRGEAMVEAAKAAKNGDTGWKEKLNKATSCKACHDLYK